MSETYSLLELRFAALFRGRSDAYGSEEGGCVKTSWDTQLIRRHLNGVTPIGVYPMFQLNGEWMCLWGCSDIDIDDLQGARSIQEALRAAGVVSYLERSRSKGYHIWVFAAEPVPAANMRRMLLCAHQVADYPAREVNPKQETLASGQYGNYVRLPYYKALDMSDSHRRILDDTGTALPLDEFISVALKGRTPIETINHLASLWKEPVASHTVINMNQSVAVADALTQLSPVGKVIWRDGPLPNKDRSTTLAKLGH